MPSRNTLRQPTRTCPLTHYLVDQTYTLGVVPLRAAVEFYIEIGSGLPPRPLTFAVDSGASCSMMSLAAAVSRRVPVPPPEAEIDLPLRTTQGAATVRVRPGRIRLWWNRQFQGGPFDRPVLFQVDAPYGQPSVLGLAGGRSTAPTRPRPRTGR
jgi:hypothetical protein